VNLNIIIPTSYQLEYLDIIERQVVTALSKEPTAYDEIPSTQLAVIATLRVLIEGNTATRTWLSGRITHALSNEDIHPWRQQAMKTLARLPVTADDRLTKKYFIAFQLIHNMEIL